MQQLQHVYYLMWRVFSSGEAVELSSFGLAVIAPPLSLTAVFNFVPEGFWVINACEEIKV